VSAEVGHLLQHALVEVVVVSLVIVSLKFLVTLLQTALILCQAVV
jgi:hypothetical protein